jgi:hypothetical protein
MPDKKTTSSAADEGDTFDLSQDIADILASFSSPKSTGTPSQENNAGSNEGGSGFQKKRASSSSGDANSRKYYRHPVRWRVAIVNKSGGKNDIYHGRTFDVSMSGISILLERNMTFTSEVVVLLAIPPIHQGLKETIVEIQCNLTHSVLDSVHSQFRLGMKYIQFKGEGKKILSEVLSKRHIPKST